MSATNFLQMAADDWLFATRDECKIHYMTAEHALVDTECWFEAWEMENAKVKGMRKALNFIQNGLLEYGAEIGVRFMPVGYASGCDCGLDQSSHPWELANDLLGEYRRPSGVDWLRGRQAKLQCRERGRAFQESHA